MHQKPFSLLTTVRVKRRESCPIAAPVEAETCTLGPAALRPFQELISRLPFQLESAMMVIS